MNNKEFVNETLDEIYEYRGIKVEIWNDDYSQSKFIKFVDVGKYSDKFKVGEEIGMGSYNFNYKDDIEYLISRKLDHICNFEDYHGSELTWFFNGYNNRDICLKYRSRILKVFLVTDEEKVSETEINTIKEECSKILQKVKKN